MFAYDADMYARCQGRLSLPIIWVARLCMSSFESELTTSSERLSDWKGTVQQSRYTHCTLQRWRHQLIVQLIMVSTQVYEDTSGLTVGDGVTRTGKVSSQGNTAARIGLLLLPQCDCTRLFAHICRTALQCIIHTSQHTCSASNSVCLT